MSISTPEAIAKRSIILLAKGDNVISDIVDKPVKISHTAKKINAINLTVFIKLLLPEFEIKALPYDFVISHLKHRVKYFFYYLLICSFLMTYDY
jgi:hypothetical protein